MEEELLYRNHFFTGRTDRWTDRQKAMVKPVYLHNFVGGGIQTYFQCGEIVEKWPPWKSKFHGGSHFFTTCGSKFNVKKFEPCQLLTLKKDPGSHFFRWKMTRGVIFQRGHYLMLHRNEGSIINLGVTRERLMHSINSPAKKSTDITCNEGKVMRRN